MSNILNNLLMRFSPESEEVVEVAGIPEADDVILDDDSGASGYPDEVLEEMTDYAIESAIVELRRGLVVMQTVSQLQHAYSTEAIDLPSFESSVKDLFQYAGLNLPVTLVVPSFEAEDKGAEKKENFVKRIIAWIRAQIEKLKKWWDSRGKDKSKVIEKAEKRLVDSSKELKDAISTFDGSESEMFTLFKSGSTGHFPSAFIDGGVFPIGRLLDAESDLISIMTEFNTQGVDEYPEVYKKATDLLDKFHSPKEKAILSNDWLSRELKVDAFTRNKYDKMFATFIGKADTLANSLTSTTTPEEVERVKKEIEGAKNGAAIADVITKIFLELVSCHSDGVRWVKKTLTSKDKE